MVEGGADPADRPLRQAVPSRDVDLLRSLWTEYLHWANGELGRRYGVHLPVDEMMEGNLADLAPFQPPAGRLLLVGDVGVGCLRSIGDEVGEIKRMYVRPSARGEGLGRRLLDGLITAADEAGYRRLRLDSARFMHAAQELYRSAGFVEIGPYEGSEIPPDLRQHWVFMERLP